MSPTTRVTIETPTEPVAAADDGDDTGEPDGMEEGLHFGRAWHRYRYCHNVRDQLLRRAHLRSLLQVHTVPHLPWHREWLR